MVMPGAAATALPRRALPLALHLVQLDIAGLILLRAAHVYRADAAIYIRAKRIFEHQRRDNFANHAARTVVPSAERRSDLIELIQANLPHREMIAIARQDLSSCGISLIRARICWDFADVVDDARERREL